MSRHLDSLLDTERRRQIAMHDARMRTPSAAEAAAQVDRVLRPMRRLVVTAIVLVTVFYAGVGFEATLLHTHRAPAITVDKSAIRLTQDNPRRAAPSMDNVLEQQDV